MLSIVYFPCFLCSTMWCSSILSPLCKDSPQWGHRFLCFLYTAALNLAIIWSSLLFSKYAAFFNRYGFLSSLSGRGLIMGISPRFISFSVGETPQFHFRVSVLIRYLFIAFNRDPLCRVVHFNILWYIK